MICLQKPHLLASKLMKSTLILTALSFAAPALATPLQVQITNNSNVSMNLQEAIYIDSDGTYAVSPGTSKSFSIDEKAISNTIEKIPNSASSGGLPPVLGLIITSPAAEQSQQLYGLSYQFDGSSLTFLPNAESPYSYYINKSVAKKSEVCISKNETSGKKVSVTFEQGAADSSTGKCRG